MDLQPWFSDHDNEELDPYYIEPEQELEEEDTKWK